MTRTASWGLAAISFATVMYLAQNHVPPEDGSDELVMTAMQAGMLASHAERTTTHDGRLMTLFTKMLNDEDLNCGSAVQAVFEQQVPRGHLIRVSCSSRYDFGIIVTPTGRYYVGAWDDSLRERQRRNPT